MAEVLTGQDMKDIQAASQVLRGYRALEALIAQIDRYRELAGQIAGLEAKKVGLAGEISAISATAERELSAKIHAAEEAAADEAQRKQQVTDGKLQAAEGRLESLRRDEERMREGMAQTRARLEGELTTLKEQIRTASEASAKSLDEARRNLQETNEAIAVAKEAAASEKRTIERDLGALKAEKQRIAGELKSILG